MIVVVIMISAVHCHHLVFAHRVFVIGVVTEARDVILTGKSAMTTLAAINQPLHINRAVARQFQPEPIAAVGIEVFDLVHQRDRRYVAGVVRCAHVVFFDHDSAIGQGFHVAVQRAQTEATDVGRQKLGAQLRVLDRCITRQAFQMVYQPIVQVDGHGIVAHEALVRCPEKELRNPHILFNVAEQGQRMWPLSRLLRKIAIGSVAKMEEGTFLFLNLHPLDFDDPDLYAPGGPVASWASRIVLEVTERAAILDLDRFRGQVKQLREYGLRIAIDDLGSGYSALGLVADLAPDYIKLDMTLVRDIDTSPVRQNLLRNMVSFARDLGARVVAEGVETREELATVRELGCHFVQGYYLARPAAQFLTRIKTTPP